MLEKENDRGKLERPELTTNKCLPLTSLFQYQHLVSLNLLEEGTIISLYLWPAFNEKESNHLKQAHDHAVSQNVVTRSLERVLVICRCVMDGPST